MSATLQDQFGRRIDYVRLSVTDRCDLRCSYCMPEGFKGFEEPEHWLNFAEIERLIGAFARLGVSRIRLTGGEPLLRRDLPDLVALLAAKPRIRDLAMTTNAMLLEQYTRPLARAGLHRVTVSLDTLRRDRMIRLTRIDALDAVMGGIEAARREGFDRLKIDTVVMRGINDDEIGDLLAFAREIGAEIRFIEYMDVGGATHWSPELVVSRREILERIADRFGPAVPVAEPSSAPADRYRLEDGTVFGLISSTTEPFCDTCDRARLTADGVWLLCLYATDGMDLRGPLRRGETADALAARIAERWRTRADRGAVDRLHADRRTSFVPLASLKKDAHLEMHTRGG